MSEKMKVKHVYYHWVEGSSLLLSDERDKWRFIQTVRAIQQKADWEIYAFCLTDSSAYFVSESDSISEIQKELVQVLTYIGETSVHAFLLQDQMGVIPGNVHEELRTLQEMIRKCIQIHKIPLVLGYVNRISDYWWSSYNSYMGIYHWALVNCQPVSLYFSDDSEESKIRFRRFHMKEQ